ncbi:hypothetical protein TRFO_23262 [Tritrichomonas foetus]|uniref:Importin N-terminal domain-containing protein n=1 Tax=Tritrichomonas foetus TaxID=1144522 RepID=A0A1J4KBH9_9EUKA|nr:hypothetical protein TRFO_23262 [Tritrichomonas foetus]|eukprot:OHT08256.1 hypothetical protein TRFO_23262 [Tritrichomonas foetus]
MDVKKLDEIVSCFLMHSNSISHEEANQKLIELTENEEFFVSSLDIFYSPDCSSYTKFIAINALKNVVSRKWQCIDFGFQERIKNFCLSFLFQNPFGTESPIDSLVFSILFSILNYEWPHNWPTFFPNFMGNLTNLNCLKTISSTQNTQSCNLDNSQQENSGAINQNNIINENNFLIEQNMGQNINNNIKELSIILCLKFISFLGNEIKSSSVTSTRAFEMGRALENEIPNVFNLINAILTTNRENLTIKVIISCFSALTSVVSYLQTEAFVETPFFTNLISSFLKSPELAEATVPFLTKLIISLNLPPEKHQIISQIFNMLMSNKNDTLVTANPLNFVSAVKTCFDYYGQVIEQPMHINQLKEALSLVMAITAEANDSELLEVCFSFWVQICQRLLIDRSPVAANIFLPFATPLMDVLYDKIISPYIINSYVNDYGIEKRQFLLLQLHSEFYSYMKQCINFLTTLDECSMIEFIKKKIVELTNEENILRICWILYSAAGSFSEAEESKFLPGIIQTLFEFALSNSQNSNLPEKNSSSSSSSLPNSLSSCSFLSSSLSSTPENQSTQNSVNNVGNTFNDHCPICFDPSIIMNVILCISQYHKLLKKYPPLLKVLVQKTCELLLNFSGDIEIVAIYALRTMITRCKTIMIQQGLFNEILEISTPLRQKLSDDGIVELYSLFGIIFRELQEGAYKEQVLSSLLELPPITSADNIVTNRSFFVALECHNALQPVIASRYVDFIKAIELNRLFKMYSDRLIELYTNNPNIAQNIPHNQSQNFIPITLQHNIQQYNRSNNMLNSISHCLNNSHSLSVNENYANGNNHVQNEQLLHSIFMVKSMIIELVTNFVACCLQPPIINEFVLPSFCELFLSDFVCSPPNFRSSRTLYFAQAILVRSEIQASVIFTPIFSTSISMIENDFNNCYELRIPFFSFMTAVVQRHFCFMSSLALTDIDKIIEVFEFACSHPQTSISQIGFNLLSDFVTSVKESSMFVDLFTRYSVELTRFSFRMLSDVSFKASFKEITNLIRNIFSIPAIVQFCPKIIEDLISTYPNIKPTDIIELVRSLVECGPYLEGIRILLKDFVVSLGQISPNDADLSIEKSELVRWIRTSFEDAPGIITDEFSEVEDHLAQGIRSISIQNH